MTQYAIYRDDGKAVARFADAPDPKRKSLPVFEEDKPALLLGHEYVGPHYREETDRLVAFWRTDPVDPLRPDVLLKRLTEIEARLNALESKPPLRAESRL